MSRACLANDEDADDNDLAPSRILNVHTYVCIYSQQSPCDVENTRKYTPRSDKREVDDYYVTAWVTQTQHGFIVLCVL